MRHYRRAMASRRSQITMSDERDRGVPRRADASSTSPRSARAATLTSWRCGTTYVDGELCFWTFAKSQKIANLRRDAKMTGLVESGDDLQRAAAGSSCVGMGRIIEDEAKVLEIGKAVAVKYNGPNAISEAALPFIEAQARKRARRRAFEIERAVSWDHTKLGGAY